MKFRVLMIALVTVLTGTAAARAEPFAAPEPQPIRLMSYNIRYDAPEDRPNWPERRPHMARQIAFFAPDVLGVQEALIPMVAYLAEQAPDYDHYGLGRDDGAEGGETTTLFWRRDRFEVVRKQTLWCSPTPDRPSKGWDAALPRTLTRVVLRDRSDGRLLDVRNAHFDHVGVVAREQCPLFRQCDTQVVRRMTWRGHSNKRKLIGRQERVSVYHGDIGAKVGVDGLSRLV